MQNYFFLILAIVLGFACTVEEAHAADLQLRRGVIGGIEVVMLEVPISDFVLQITGNREGDIESSTIKQAKNASRSLNSASQRAGVSTARAILSAGFAGLDPSEPQLGVVEEGRSYSPFMGRQSRLGSVGTAVICIAGARPYILTIEQFLASRQRCEFALQTGPVVGYGGSPANIMTRERTSWLIACDRSNRGTFAFFFFEEATLTQVASSLANQCEVAVNISVPGTAGVSIWQDGRIVEKAGRIDVPVPALIIISSR